MTRPIARRHPEIDLTALDQRRAYIFWEYVFVWTTPHSIDSGLAMARELRGFDASMGYAMCHIAAAREIFSRTVAFADLIDVKRGRSLHKGVFGDRTLTDEERWQCISIARAIRLRDEHEGLFVQVGGAPS